MLNSNSDVSRGTRRLGVAPIVPLLDQRGPVDLSESQRNSILLPTVVDALWLSCFLGLRGPRLHAQYFMAKPARVWRAIESWGPLPSETDTFPVDALEVHTDGSAVLDPGWPATPVNAGWGVVFFAVLPGGLRRFLGALWGPVSVQQGNPYFVGATRPTIPVAELSTITHCLRMLRMASFMGTVVWGTDSMYALGIILGDMAASTEAALVRCARLEATYAVREWRLRGHHTPSHIGFPPNECADVIAMMGRLQLRLSAAVETMLMTVINRIPVEYQRETFSLFQALQWTVLDDLSEVLMDPEPPKRMANVMVVECASANVLTLHPQEKGRGEKTGFDSHRRAGHFLLVRLLLLFLCCGCMIARVSAPRQKLPCNSCSLVLWQGLQPGHIFQ